jgi:hypothetical protein
MIRIAWLAAVMSLFLLGAEVARAQQWIAHQPDGAGYRVEFPAKPVESTQSIATKVGPVKTRTSAIEVGDKVFMTVRSSYPTNVTIGDPQTNLDGIRDGSVRNVNGKLLSEERLNVSNAPARLLLIDMPRSNRAAEALMVLDGNRLCQAVYVGPPGTENTPEAKRFLSSFALLH